jgi:hypothetical protein
MENSEQNENFNMPSEDQVIENNNNDIINEDKAPEIESTPMHVIDDRATEPIDSNDVIETPISNKESPEVAKNKIIINDEPLPMINHDPNGTAMAEAYATSNGLGLNNQEPKRTKSSSATNNKNQIFLSMEKCVQIKPIILDSVNSLGNIFTCTNSHANHIIYIFKLLNDNAFRKVNNTLNLSKKFVQYFKEVTIVYQKFSMDIAKTNIILSSCTQDTILSDNINIMIEKTQEAIAGKFISFSNILYANIVNKGPFQKVKEMETRLNKITKEIAAGLLKVEQKKDKISKNFNLRILPTLESIKKSYDNDAQLLPILDKNELYLFEIEIMNSVMKMYNKFFDFFKSYKTQMTNLRSLILEFMTVIRDSVELYINENKKIFSDTEAYCGFETMKKFYDSLTEEYLNGTFNIENIVSDKTMKNYFNDTLKALQNTLMRFATLRQITNEDLLKKDELFSVGHFKSIDEFVDFVTGFMPKNLDIADKDAERSPLIIFQQPVRRDPGMFSSWRSAHLVITLQESLFVFDEKVTKKPAERLKVKKLKLNYTPEKKVPFRFVLTERKKVMFFNTNTNVVIDPHSKEILDEINALIQKIQSE